MTKDTLQDLIEVHNALYSFPVAGAMVIPMAQIQVTLQKIIADIGREFGEVATNCPQVSEVQ